MAEGPEIVRDKPMQVAIVGASGKTGVSLVHQSLERGYRVVAVCRDSSADKLAEFSDRDGLTVMTTPVVSDESTLTRALSGCDAVVAILIAVRRLKATDLVSSLAKATAANGLKRLVFTAGEITAEREEGEEYTLRQRLMRRLIPPMLWFTPYSVTDMLKASVMIARQADWEWTIMRAPTLSDKSPVGYRLCEINEVSSAHVLSRTDYAVCLLDSLENREHHRRTLTVVAAHGTG
jgi:putative NADH-flavin reductase